MALSLSNFLYAITGFAIFGVSQATTHVFDWNITWVTANPDGLYDRPVIGINNQWPVPSVNITKGDRVIVHATNSLGNQTTSLHFHGLYQNGTTQMDGPVGVSQCAIALGSTFTYNFTVDQPGTYWYHSHEKGQYPDGLRGSFIVYDPESPYLGQYDEEYVLTLSDWYHEEMQPLLARFISVYNPTGAEPVPDSDLMNESQNGTFSVEAGKTYLFRIINMGAFAGQHLWFEGHTMRIVEVDGTYTEAQEAEMIYITAAQRYSVLVTARNDTTSNFAIVGSMDEDLFDTVPTSLNPNVTGYLLYNDQEPLPAATLLDEFNDYDDFNLVPYDREELFTDVTRSIEMTMKMAVLGDGANYAFINDVTYVRPKIPTLYSVLSTGTNATDPTIYGVNTNAFVLEQNEVVEIVFNNADAGKHPFHLHGHSFQVVVRADEDAGYYLAPSNVTADANLPQIPMRRDTLMVRPGSHFVIRFRSDNPGVWLFHCHIEWHVSSGLIATIIEAPLELQKSLTVPADHYQACIDTKTAYKGNAAGNTEDYTDLSGAATSHAPLPSGFTARGIVALVFSAVSAVLGMIVIGWYGTAPLGTATMEKAVEKVEEVGRENGDAEAVGEALAVKKEGFYARSRGLEDADEISTVSGRS